MGSEPVILEVTDFVIALLVVTLVALGWVLSFSEKRCKKCNARLPLGTVCSSCGAAAK
jgi:hypothetical protein